MTETNVLTGRARFDKPDAQAVVLFLQQEPGNDHRGYNQPELANEIAKKNKVHMALTEVIVLSQKGVGFASLEKFMKKVTELSAETGITPELECYGGALQATMRWDRPATQMEQVAAKAYLRDHKDDGGYAKFKTKRSYSDTIEQLQAAYRDPFGGEEPASPEPMQAQNWEYGNTITSGTTTITRAGGGRWVTLDDVLAAPTTSGDTNTNG